jgi:hypothetical protein
MLVKLVDHKGKTHFVNPLYVRCVVEKKPGVIEVHGSVSVHGGKLVIKDGSLEDISDQLSLALASIGGVGGPVVTDGAGQPHHAAANAGAIATGGGAGAGAALMG